MAILYELEKAVVLEGCMMVHEFQPNFPHRLNGDWAYDSLCSLCHQTVATAKNEAELSQHERGHKCDPVLRYQVSQGSDLSQAITA
jgi:hypothetical protein